MKMTAKYKNALMVAVQLGLKFRRPPTHEQIYQTLAKENYQWDSVLGVWRYVQPVELVRVRVLAMPKELDVAVDAVVLGMECGGYKLCHRSAPCDSGNHPKYAGDPKLRVYLTFVVA